MFEGHDGLLEELAVKPGINYIGYVGRNNSPFSSGKRGPLPKKHPDYLTHPIDLTAVYYENASRLQSAEIGNDKSKIMRLVKAVGFDVLFKKEYVNVRPVTNANTDRDVREAEQAQIERVRRRTGYKLLNSSAAARTESAKRKRIEDSKQRDQKRNQVRRRREMAFG